MKEEEKEFAKARSNIYRFLSSVYLNEPSKELIEAINKKEFREALEVIFPEEAELLRQDNIILEELVVEYHSLFNVPLNQYVAPYESAYREGLLYIKAGEVKKFYEANGFLIVEDYKELPDHVGLELEFMGHLCEKGDLEAQKIFLKEHLIKWVPNLCEDIIRKSKSDFYKGIAGITKKFLEMEEKLLAT